MRFRALSPATVAICGGLSVVGFGARAAAYSCGPPRELVPLHGAEFPGTGQILDICYYYAFDGKPLPEPLCGAPVLEDSDGRRIELFEEQQVRAEAHPAVGRGVGRVITAYRPASALAPGRFRVSGTQYYALSNEFSVVEAVATPPALPVLSAIDFSRSDGIGLAVSFAFEPFDGSLAVERNGIVREPLEALDISGAGGTPDQPRDFWLVNMPCQANFPEIDYGVSTTLRFGVLDAYGSFSGWTEPLLYTVPTQEEAGAQDAAQQAAQQAVDAQAARERAELALDRTPSGGCSLSMVRPPPPSRSWLLALVALFAGRSLSRRRG